MSKLFAKQSIHHNPIIFTTRGQYSMDAAVEILNFLSLKHNCHVRSSNWEAPHYGALVEVGIEVQIESLVFSIMCSHQEIFIEKISGSKILFLKLMAEIQNMSFKVESKNS